MSPQARIAMDPCTGDLQVLPYEVLLRILHHLPPADRVATCLANKYLWHARVNQRWMEDFRRNRSPEPSWDPPRLTSMQWHPPAQGGLLQLLVGLERDAPGTIHVCPNCKVIHRGPYARSSLRDVQYISTEGHSDLLDSRGLCAASGSSDWEVRDLFLEGSRRSFPVAEKREFHTRFAGRFSCHRVTRVLLSPSVVLALPAVTENVILSLQTCPFVICSHFAIQVMNTTNVPMTNLHLALHGDEGSRRSRINTSRGWVLPFDAENNRAVPSGRVEQGGWSVCSSCGATWGVTKHSHGERGVEIVLDVFHRPEHRLDWRDCWQPAFPVPMSKPDRKLDGWAFCAPLLVPGASGMSDASLGAAELVLKERYLSADFSFEG
ncbi:uncharacterized protein LA080_000961 [Diaporthe eres]|uniref:F-box domain-containing protein n=1 Tax=Diaporthe vaccinii TaxID=105482 RepID=A0ABR4FCL0_9PEZI|nr:uncharacterized protein LA080_000961 [Diaporthe eres]